MELWGGEARNVLAAAIRIASVLPVVFVIYRNSNDVEVRVGGVAKASYVGCARAGVHEAACLASIRLGSKRAILLLKWELTHWVWWWTRRSCLALVCVGNCRCKEHSHDREDTHLEAQANSYVRANRRCFSEAK